MATTLTLSEFKVDLAALESASQAVAQQADIISQRTALITGVLQHIGTYWSTPAEQPFGELVQPCITQMTNLNELLTEMVSRMRTAYQNYLQAEQANVSNFPSS